LDGLAPPDAEAEPEPPEPALDDPLDDDPLEAEDELLGAVLVVVVDVVVVGVVVAAAAVAVGTVSGGAPEVSAAVEPPPPQAASAAETPMAAASNASFLINRAVPLICPLPSGTERFHTPAAVGAVVQVLRRKLVAPVAKPQVLDGPRQFRRGGREREQLAHDLELLSGLTVEIDAVRLGFDNDLAAGGGRPHAVLLARPHPPPSYRELG
jgi:hypothetical protein